MLAALLWLLPGLGFALQEDELLEPEQAFALSSIAQDANTVVARWMIADGYYMYRERFRLESLTPGISLGEPTFPAGKVKDDEYFGPMEVYRGAITVEIPIRRSADAPAQLELKTTSQGCADLGVCYPPQIQTSLLDLPQLAQADLTLGKPLADPADPPTAGKLNLLQNLTQGLQTIEQEGEIPDPDIAFIPSVQTLPEGVLRASWVIDDCCYMYRERFAFTSLTPGVILGEPKFPPGKKQHDEFYGETEIYRSKVSVEIPVHYDATVAAAPSQLDLKTNFQGCADIGVCYPPQEQVIPVMLAALNLSPAAGTLTAAPPAAPPATNTTGLAAAPAANNPSFMALTSTQPPVAEQDMIAGMLVQQQFWALPAFIGFGLLLAFTPCVFPMVPILSSIIVGQGENLTQRRAFMLSLVYVLAMALTYTVAGVLAAMLGQNIQALFQNPWVLISFSAVFVLLALSMFGFYDLQLPRSWQNRLTEISNRQGSGYTGVAVMGLLSALIVGPCVAPPLIGVLSVIAGTGDAVLGGAALFAMSIGMGLPLILIGTSAGKWLPKAGRWMDIVKAVFGVLLLAVAIWMLERILPAAITMLLWAVLLIVSAVYMGAFQTISGENVGWRTLTKGLGTVMMVYGVLLLVGVASGGRDALQPLRGVLLAGGGQATHQEVNFRLIKTVADLETQIAQAGGRPVMLDFYADWCVSCKEMERYTFSDPDVMAALDKAILLQADVTANDEADQALLKRFGLIGPPSILFFNAGIENPAYRVVGFMGAEQFRGHVQQAMAPSLLGAL